MKKIAIKAALLAAFSSELSADDCRADPYMVSSFSVQYCKEINYGGGEGTGLAIVVIAKDKYKRYTQEEFYAECLRDARPTHEAYRESAVAGCMSRFKYMR